MRMKWTNWTTSALGFIKQGESCQPVALLSLDGQNNLYLHSDGPMALAHAQLFSVNQLNQLTERSKLHVKHATQEVSENLDSLLDGLGDDDDLTFDFDN